MASTSCGILYNTPSQSGKYYQFDLQTTLDKVFNGILNPFAGVASLRHIPGDPFGVNAVFKYMEALDGFLLSVIAGEMFYSCCLRRI